MATEPLFAFLSQIACMMCVCRKKAGIQSRAQAPALSAPQRLVAQRQSPSNTSVAFIGTRYYATGHRKKLTTSRLDTPNHVCRLFIVVHLHDRLFSRYRQPSEDEAQVCKHVTRADKMEAMPCLRLRYVQAPSSSTALILHPSIALPYAHLISKPRKHGTKASQ
jgi:hypothetical protein